MKKINNHYGGKTYGFINSKWLTFWLSDYRKNTIVPYKFQLEIYSYLWGNLIIKL